MSEKARGGIFSALGDIEQLKLLDAYSGSGAIAFEAISRGALSVTCVEQNRTAHQNIKTNAERLGIIGKLSLFNSTIEAWLKFNHELFDIVIADPPYNDLKPDALDRLFDKALKVNGLFVLSWPAAQILPTLATSTAFKQKPYGDALIGYYRKDKN